MVHKSHRADASDRPTYATSSLEYPKLDTAHGPLSTEHYVEVLSTDYPLIDTTLILSLLSDYDDPSAHLEEIRDQLGILEATLVPDTIPHSVSASSEFDEASVVDLKGSLRALNLAVEEGQIDSESSKSSRYPSSKTQPTSISMSKSTSSSSIVSHSEVIEEGSELAAQVDLLKSLFSSVPSKTIQHAILNEPSLPAAIDHLLSLELIRQVEQDGTWSGEDAETASSGQMSDGFVSAVESRSKARRKKAPKSVAVPLVDTLQRRSTPSSPRPSSRTITSAGPSSNAWGTVASLSAYLSDQLQTPQNHFLSYFHSPNYHSALAAIQGALAALPAIATSREHVAILEDLYGSQLTENPAVAGDLEACARVTDDVSIIMDLMDLMAEVSQWPGDDDVFAVPNGGSSRTSTPSTPVIGSVSMTPTSSADSLSGIAKPAPHSGRLITRPNKVKPNSTPKIVPGSQSPATALSHPTAMDNFGQPSAFAPLLSAKAAHLNGSMKQVHPLNWRTVSHTRIHPSRTHHPLASSIPAYARGSTPHDPTPGSLYRRSTTSAEVQMYYAHAEKERAKRADAIRAAATHFSGSALPGGKSVNVVVAGHYASQAREAEARAKEWEMKAARSVIDSQLSETGNGIDLHHLTVEEGTVVALEMVRKWWDYQRATSGAGLGSGLVVVTGKGRHSKGQRGILGPAVAGTLKRDGWRVEEGVDRGYLVVKGRV